MDFNRMFVYEADDGKNGGGSGDPEPDNTGNATGSDQSKAYTQAELDKMFSERSSRAKEAEAKRILEALGVDDLEAAQSGLQRLSELEDAQKSELEKLQDKLSNSEKLTDSQEAQIKELTTMYEVQLAAGKLGVVDPEAAYKLLDLEVIKYDKKTGKPQNIEALLNALIEERPYLKGQPRRAVGNAGAGTDNPPGSADDMNDLIRAKAGRA